MQIVGAACEVCHQKLLSELGADGCVVCDVVFHVKCLEDADRCPRCREPFRESEEAAERAIEAADARSRSTGHGVALFVVAVFGVTVAAGLAFTLLTWRSEEEIVFASRVAGAVVVAALLVLFYQGRRGTNTWLGAAAVVNAIAPFVTKRTAHPVAWLLGGVYVACALALFTSQDLANFMADQRRRRGDVAH